MENAFLSLAEAQHIIDNDGKTEQYFGLNLTILFEAFCSIDTIFQKNRLRYDTKLSEAKEKARDPSLGSQLFFLLSRIIRL